MTAIVKHRKSSPCIKPENLLLVLTALGVVLGAVVGSSLKYSDIRLTSRQENILGFPGEVFLRVLKLLVVPLMFSSLVNSLANLDTGTAGRLLFLGISYYAITIGLAVATGIVMVLLIQPGRSSPLDSNLNDQADVCKGTGPVDAILDLLRNIFLDNIVEATFRSKSTCLKYIFKKDNDTLLITFDEYNNLTSHMKELVKIEPYIQEKSGMNVLGIIVFALFFGSTIGQIGDKGKPLKKFFSSLEIVIMRLVSMAIWLAPIGILSLIAKEIAKMDDLGEEAMRLIMFVATVMVGFAFHFFITLQLIMVFLVRRNPFKFVYEVLQALLTAFATASSSATMPLTLKCLEENVKCDKRVTKFLVPLGATVNMNGTALYEAVASIYIAQCLGLELTIGRVIIISFTSVLASVGASGMPHAGMITMIMVLIAIGLPPAYFALVVPVDWFIDRFRTAINVYDDMVACVLVEKYCKDILSKNDDYEDTLPVTTSSLDYTMNNGQKESKNVADLTSTSPPKFITSSGLEHEMTENANSGTNNNNSSQSVQKSNGTISLVINSHS